MREFTADEAAKHNTLYERGWNLVRDSLLLHERHQKPGPGWLEKRRLRDAIRCFEGALQIHPDGWQSMWAIGKIYQRLGNQEAAFDWFSRSHSVNPAQPDVAREASIAALDTGRAEQAIALCRAAIESNPDDPGLVCNLALAYCLAGNDSEAVRCAEEAVNRNPADQISANVLAVVQQVEAGTRPRPKTLGVEFG